MSTPAAHRSPVLAKATAAWPAIRGVLVALHVLAIVVLSLPSTGQLTDERRWRSANTKVEMERWAAMLERWGVHTTPEALTHRLREWADSYVRARRRIAAPFDRYAQLSGAQQGWSMFASPQKVPAEVHVDVRVGASWQPLVRPWDRTLDWHREAREHHRVRKALGRLARSFRAERYEGLARWLATEAARDLPEIEEIRVAIWRRPSPSIAQARSGEAPEGRYEHVLVFDAEALR